MNSIAKILKDTREDLDLSQMDVMKKTGISNKSLSRYENDITEPDIETLSVLFELYGLSLDSVLGLESKTPKKNMFSEAEINLLLQLRELPNDLRNMIFEEVKILSSLNIKK